MKISKKLRRFLEETAADSKFVVLEKMKTSQNSFTYREKILSKSEYIKFLETTSATESKLKRSLDLP